jgi:hypothetical protein
MNAPALPDSAASNIHHKAAATNANPATSITQVIKGRR